MVVVDQIHFGDQNRDLMRAHQRQQIGVPARLLLQALLRVDHQERALGIGGAGDHIFQELFVSRCIDDDVLAAGGLEGNAAHIDGDALIALRLERIQQERPLHTLAAAFGDGANLLDLAFRQRPGFIQQAADEGRFAVVDMADDDQLQGILSRKHDVRRSSGHGLSSRL